MRTLYIECNMGAAGDMLSAALLELLPDPEAFLLKMNALGIPGVKIERESSVKCGITGTHLKVTVDGMEETSADVRQDSPGTDSDELTGGQGHDHSHRHGHDQDYCHDHSHRHGHDQDYDHVHVHHHTSMAEIEALVDSLPVPETVRTDILAVYGLIAEAESHAHAVPVTEIHFHEVGTMDAVADITMVCLLIHELGPERIVVSPVATGYGEVLCAHGILPVPAPATAYLLRGIPSYAGREEGELCTPTGAALLKHFATEFGNMPVMCTEQIGYGMGKKNFTAANCVRAVLGDTGGSTDEVCELSCNVDDMTAEAIAFATESFLESGALEAYTVPIGMKKSRPGTLICVMCRVDDRDRMTRLMFEHTTTIGIREKRSNRYILNRQMKTLATPYGPVRQKNSSGYGVEKSKYEYEDIARIARAQGVSLARAGELAAETGDPAQKAVGMETGDPAQKAVGMETGDPAREAARAEAKPSAACERPEEKTSLSDKYERLLTSFRQAGSAVIAFSGGVDSTFLLWAAHEALGDRAIAVTAASPLFPERELTEAENFCRENGIRQRIFTSNELDNEEFAKNPKDRCYICKRSLFDEIMKIAAENGIAHVCEGSNLDDEGDYRPGLRAVEELGIESPLRACGFKKAEIRALSKELGLPTWEKPSFACLASRFVYGEKIDEEHILMVDRAEQLLIDLGFRQVRVRIHGNMARIEVGPDEIARLLEEETRAKIWTELKRYGFSYVTVDLKGYQMGSMNP